MAVEVALQYSSLSFIFSYSILSSQNKSSFPNRNNISKLLKSLYHIISTIIRTHNTPAPEPQAIHNISTQLDIPGRVCLLAVKTLKDKRPSSFPIEKGPALTGPLLLSHPRFYCLQVPLHPCGFNSLFSSPFPQECYFCVIFSPRLPANPYHSCLSSKIGTICRGKQILL